MAEIFKSTPYIADLKPGGRYVAKDMYEAGGAYMVMKSLLVALVGYFNIYKRMNPIKILESSTLMHILI